MDANKVKLWLDIGYGPKFEIPLRVNYSSDKCEMAVNEFGKRAVDTGARWLTKLALEVLKADPSVLQEAFKKAMTETLPPDHGN
jgi:hypothetical protein